MSLQRVEADPEKKYTLTESNGPWMILAVTFTGDEADRQADELALELRKRYKMPAFVHPVDVNLSSVGAHGYDRKGKPRKMKYQLGSQLHEVAVMVGNYSAVDDVAAQRDLKKIKDMRPECLEPKDGKKVSRSFGALRSMQQMVQSGFLDEKKKAFVHNVKANRGTMASAFVTTNPLLPRDFYVPSGLDKEIVEMNRGVKHSLLDCPGRYSVKVATFTGCVVMEPERIKAIEAGEKMPSKLVEAAEDAHEMTELLRAKGYEAYEFHDNYSSVVCVGSFDSVGNKQADGRIVADPAILKVIEEFGLPQLMPGKSTAQTGKPKTLKIRGREVPFDLQPLPVEVPRQSIAKQYEHRVERF